MAESVRVTDVRVPEVRLVELGPLARREQVVGVRAAETADLISVEVTRHASGPGDYKLTLNNWDPRRNEHKYNDLAVLRFGQRLRIDMRYLGPQFLESAGKDAPSGWVPMISGPITDLQFSFGSDGSRVAISGEDDLRPLKDHTAERLQYKLNELGIIQRTLEARNYHVELRAAMPERLRFIAEPSPRNRINEAQEKGQSYLEYIQKFIEKYDLELFLAFVEAAPQPEPQAEPQPGPDKPEAATFDQVLKLVASRANAGPLEDIIVLRHGHELIDFSPTIKVADQYTSARVRGRNRFRDEPKGVDGIAKADVVKEEVDRYLEKDDLVLVPAPDVRRHFFDGENPSPDKERTNLDEYRAEAAARATLLRKARELMVVQATTVGLPRLQPGRYIRIEGISDPFEGLYYVASTTHSWGSDGAKVRLTAHRAGMPMPPYKKKGAAA